MNQILALALVGLTYSASLFAVSVKDELAPPKAAVNQKVIKFLLLWSTPPTLEAQLNLFLQTLEGFARPAASPEGSDLNEWGRNLANHMLRVQYLDQNLEKLQNAIQKDSASREDLIEFCETNAGLLLRTYTLAMYARELRHQLNLPTRFGTLASALTGVSSACVAALGGLSSLYAHKSIKGAWVGAIPIGMYWGAKQVAEASAAAQLSVLEIRAGHNLRRLKNAIR